MNILIVDDDPDLTELATRWLVREGHHVRHAATGTIALDMLEAGPLPDLVLLDVMLPYISGYDLLQRLRADERTRRLPVLLVSSYFDGKQDVARGMALGADDYILKPLMEYDFLGRIARFVQPDKK